MIDMARRDQDRDYRYVKPTPEEIAEWRSKHSYPRPYRIACKACGKRMWLSGIGVGSHRRACPGPPKIEEVRCYSDHNEDIRTKGSCDYCGGTERDR